MRLRKLVEAEADKPEIGSTSRWRCCRPATRTRPNNCSMPCPPTSPRRSRGARPRPPGLRRAAEGRAPRRSAGSGDRRDPNDLRARHLLGVHRIVAGDAEAGLEQFLEMLRRDRAFEEGLPRKALIDAFRVIEDAELVGRYRRRMASLLLV